MAKRFNPYSDVFGDIGSKIKDKRLEKGLSQGQLSELSGVSQSTLSRAENGGSITVVSLFSLLMSLYDQDSVLVDILGSVESTSYLYLNLTSFSSYETSDVDYSKLTLRGLNHHYNIYLNSTK